MAVRLRKDADPIDHAGFEDLRVGEALSNLVRAVFLGGQRDCRAQGLTVAQARLLTVVAATGAVSPSELGRQLGLSRQAMSSASHFLEKEGLIARAHAPNDRRQVLLLLTAQGRRRYRAVEARQHRVHRRLEKLIPEAERAPMARELMHLAEGLANSRSIHWYRCSRCAREARIVPRPG
jgi:DNA-binding MarR family transcriptional regulator